MSNFTKRPSPPAPNKPNKAQQELAKRELCRRDLLQFAREFSTFEYRAGWFHRELTNILMYAFEAAKEGKQPRIIIEAPPRVGKSQDVVRAFVAWLVGHMPHWEVAIATYNQELADDHGRDVRSVLMDPRYNNVFANAIIDKTKRAVDQCAMVGSKGGFKAVGVGSALTGRGAHVLIVDDPIKDMEEARSETHTKKLFDWFQAVAMTRLAPEANLVVVMATRWSELDLTGRILDSEIGKDYHLVSFPALALEDEEHRKKGEPINPERFPSMEAAKAYYENLRATLDSKIWNSLYQQQPFAEDGEMFKAADLKLTTQLPKKLNYYITCDPAASEKESSDFWAAMVFGVDSDLNIYAVDNIHLRGVDAVQRYLDALFGLVKKYKPLRVELERCHATNVLEPILKRMMRERNQYFMYDTVPTGNKDKRSRAQSIAARVQQGKVYLLDNAFSKETAIPELVKFPDGRNDDVVDCFSMMGNMLDKAHAVGAPIPLDVPKVVNVLDTIRSGKKKTKSPTHVGMAKVPEALF